MTVIRVVLADDEQMMRTGLALMVGAEADLEVVGEASDGVEAVEMVRSLRPDVVVMDVRMPRLDGLGATRAIMHEADWPVRIIVLTTFDLDEYVVGALRLGASGFLLKTSSPRQLPMAIREVYAGETMLASAVTRRLIERYISQEPAGSSRLDALTAREREVLVHVAHGLSNAEIAGRLVLSLATVKTHVIHILAKLGLRDRTQAAIAAYEAGLVGPGDASRTDTAHTDRRW